MTGIAEAERQKYEKAWGIDAYHSGSPGVLYQEMFQNIAKPQPGQTVLDIGAGAGAASVKMKEAGLRVIGYDLTNAAWAHPGIPLWTGTIWKFRSDATFDFGFCCDVMEHIPPQFVALTLDRILAACDRAFFSISFTPDVMGAGIGETLHLTVRPFKWWRDTFREVGTLYDARDLLGDGVFYAGR